MPSVCMKPFGGTRMRVTKLDSCGVPLTGVGSCSIVTKGFVSVERTAEFADPDEFVAKNADGDLCLNERSPALFRWYNLTITFCEVDPDLYAMLTGNPVVLDDTTPTPRSVGWRTREGANVNANVAIELWTKLGGQQCSGGVPQWGYYLLPFVKEGTAGDLTIANAASSFVVTNARTAGGAGWAEGPYDVLNTVQTPGPSPLLAPMTAIDHDHFQMTTLAPPAVPGTCGCVQLAP